MKYFIHKIIGYFHRRKISSYKKQVKISSSTRLLRGFKFLFLSDISDRLYLSVGSECVLNSHITFEANTGLVEIGDRCYIGAQTSIISRKSIAIGNDVTIAWGVTIYDHDSHSLDWQERVKAVGHFYNKYGALDCYSTIDWSHINSSPIVISDRVWIGFDAVILKGVTIGEGAIIGARSVVTKDVEPYTVVAGNPARLVKHLHKAL